MQIYLSDDTVSLIHQKAAAAGFPNQIDAYVAHLIASDVCEDYGAPTDLTVAGKSREEIEAMITAGTESGPATEMSTVDWQRLHACIDERDQASS